MFTIEKILDEARNEGATDVYLMTGSIPKYRKADKIKNLNYPKLTSEKSTS
jgi:Tfp pilus assembly pilus retraction ATPase PilT